MYDSNREALQTADISSEEAVARIWRDAIDEARSESVDRERRAVRSRKLPFGFSASR